MSARSRTVLTRPLACTLLAALAVGCAAQKPAIGNGTPLEPDGEGTGGSNIADTEADSAAVGRELETVLQPGHEKLETFASNKDLAKYLDHLRKKQEKRYRGFGAKSKSAEAGAPPPSPSSAPMADAAEPSAAAEGEADGDESITNTQEQGVDEGGIVKTHGDHLVVLRRGRLFTVEVGDDQLRPISNIGVTPAPGHDAWYDEMLIHDDTIVVVGFSYQVGATELGIFRIDDRGQLTHRDTFFLRSNDYYSSRNYASRLLGDKLVFYMPYYLGYDFDTRNPNLPGIAHWDTGRGRVDDWDLVIEGNEIYRPVQETENPVLHTVVTCDLSRPQLRCDAQGILGPYGRSFYVSQNAVYVWTHEGGYGEHPEGAPPAAVYRLPLGRGEMGALRVFGAPVDQFSFKESSDGHLNVLVRAEGAGDAMWAPEFSSGDIGMLRVPVVAFGRGVSTVAAEAFVDLPEPEATDYYAFQNRFVGDYLLYGSGSGWGHAAQRSDGQLFAHRFASGRDHAEKISVPHGIDRIEAMADDAVVVGSDGRNLHFTAVELGERPMVAGAFVQRDAAQGELRSHGFFYKPQTADTGLLGLPIRHTSQPGYAHLVHGSAEVLFLQVADLNFSKLGSLASDPRTTTDDNCQVSCVDWYGNARPIFYQGRIFALLGYELVEGSLTQGRMTELRRTNMLDQSRKQPIWKAK